MQHTPVYKTAAELKIQPWERDALVALIGPLSRGELGLDMRQFHTCNSVHCIGGWMMHLGGRSREDETHSRALKPLFFPPLDNRAPRARQHPGWGATGLDAARAVINFLTLGEPRWDDVMRDASGSVIGGIRRGLGRAVNRRR